MHHSQLTEEKQIVTHSFLFRRIRAKSRLLPLLKAFASLRCWVTKSPDVSDWLYNIINSYVHLANSLVNFRLGVRAS